MTTEQASVPGVASMLHDSQGTGGHGERETGSGDHHSRPGGDSTGRDEGPDPMDPNLDPADTSPAQHAFIMLGKKTVFLCHMAMFDHEDHCYQLIMRATLPDFALKRYLDGSRESPEASFFLANSKRDELLVPDIASGARRSFSADIFRNAPHRAKSEGWPWAGRSGYLVIGDVPVTVDHIVYCRHFDFGLEKPPYLKYLLFGNGDEAHLTHYQTPTPDFDHILSLEKVPVWLPPRKVEMGVHVTFPDLREDPKYLCVNPLQAGQEYGVRYYGQGPRREIVVGRTWWFSAAIMNARDPCVPRVSGQPPAGGHRH